MTTTELIELLKKNERGGATGRPREVMFEVGDRIIDTDGIEVTGTGDGLITELYLSLPSAQPEIVRCKDCIYHAGWDYCEEVDGLWYDDDFCCRGEKGKRREE
jgi:hypothetical protein